MVRRQSISSPVGNERRAFSFYKFKEREFAAKASEFFNLKLLKNSLN